MRSNPNNLSRGEKILFFLYEFSKGGRTKIRYEDIVAGLFKKYPNDFQLKGYPEYPDSGDLIHKPLYDFKKKGYLNAANKVFSLTERGVEYASQLSGKKDLIENSEGRLSRSTHTEVSRVRNLEGFSLFLDAGKDKLSNGDFYSYFGVTVRTPKNAFLGRLETMNAVIDELKKYKNNDLYKTLIDYHNFLVTKHVDIIDFFKKD